MSDDLIYKPAKRSKVGWLIMLAGPADSGKTFSALRLATGLAQGGGIGFADTEHGRALYYADQFQFNHLEINEPFRPSKFEAAAIASQQQKHAVWICDNFSWEHMGPGGLLDWHEAELQRMAGDNYERREKVKWTAWIKPKGEHTRLLQRLWQMNSHIILCVQAKKKMDLDAKDEKTGKMKPKDLGLQPVCGEDIPYAMTASFMLDPERRGVPIPIKLMEQHEGLFPKDRPLDEETGAAIAAWARGETPAPRTSAAKPATRSQAPAAAPERKPAPDHAAIAAALVKRFDATMTMQEHMAIMDEAITRQQVEWLSKKRPDLYQDVDRALRESWARTSPSAGSAEQPVESQTA